MSRALFENHINLAHLIVEAYIQLSNNNCLSTEKTTQRFFKVF